MSFVLCLSHLFRGLFHLFLYLLRSHCSGSVICSRVGVTLKEGIVFPLSHKSIELDANHITKPFFDHDDIGDIRFIHSQYHTTAT